MSKKLGKKSSPDSQSSGSSGYQDDCDMSAGEFNGWMLASINPGNATTNVSSVEDSAEVDSDSEKISSFPVVEETPPVASINRKISTSTHLSSYTNISSSSSSSKYYDSAHGKRKFQQLRRQQQAIMDDILQEKDEKISERVSEQFISVQSNVQSTMTQHFVPRSKMKNSCLNEQNQKKKKKTKGDLLQRSSTTSVFHSDDEFDLSSFDVRWRRKEFKYEVEQHEKKNSSSISLSYKKPQKRPVYKAFASLSKKEQSAYCLHCNNYKKNCRDVVIGPFCRDQFVRYYHEESKQHVDLLTAKKIFFNSYDNYREMKEYEFSQVLVIPKCKECPPKCVMQGSYGFCLEWFKYKMNDGFIDKRIDNSKEYTYDVKEFDRY